MTKGCKKLWRPLAPGTKGFPDFIWLEHGRGQHTCLLRSLHEAGDLSVQPSPGEALSPVLCVCVFVLVCVCVLVCETVPVEKKLIRRLVSPWFLKATEGNPQNYAASNGREETICIPEVSSAILQQPWTPLSLGYWYWEEDLKWPCSKDCVEERRSISKLQSSSRALLCTSWLSHLSIVDLEWVWPSGLHSYGHTKDVYCIKLYVPHLYLFNFWGDHGLSKSFPPSLLSKGTSSLERWGDEHGHLRVKEPG